MFNKAAILFVCVFLLSGCIYNEEPMPEITSDNTDTVIIPEVLKAKKTVSNYQSVPQKWYPFRAVERKWTAIVIHHSGTREGNMAIFDRWHREGNHWEGVGYHFVIGNGIGSSDGLVEVTYRWRNQQTGAHCGGTAGNWANREGVGICLVGDFNKTSPTPLQMKSLVKLIRFLQLRYRIETNRIYGHKTTPGARVTECPGRKFPMAGLKSLVGEFEGS